MIALPARRQFVVEHHDTALERPGLCEPQPYRPFDFAEQWLALSQHDGGDQGSMPIDETMSRERRAELGTADQQQVATRLPLDVRDRLRRFPL